MNYILRQNSLVLLLMFYRLFVLYEAHHEAAKMRRRSSSACSSYGSTRHSRPSIAFADVAPIRQAMMATAGLEETIKEEEERGAGAPPGDSKLLLPTIVARMHGVRQSFDNCMY